jgi:4-diphosphocytidyl-2C-methyl-D-erythritol kinase
LSIKIHKKIPLMSGIGGSATDIAAIIKWISKKYKLIITNTHLKYIAKYIGSDVPFFLSGHSKAWVSNYGEIVKQTKQKIPRFDLILTNIKIATKCVYAKMNKNYQSLVNIKQACKYLNFRPWNSNIVYNDMWQFANSIDKKLVAAFQKLNTNHNLILSGSGGSFIVIK